MAEIKLITFDLDNTLWSVEEIIIKAESDMRNWMKTNAPESLSFYSAEYLPKIRQDVIDHHPNKRFDLSFLRLETLYHVMLKTGLDKNRAREKATRAFEIFFEGRNKVAFFPGALPLLEELQDSYKIFALTNGNANIVKIGLDKYMDGAISAADVNAGKPDPAMFELLLERTGFEASDAVHIGDNLVDDIEGATRAGFHSIWVNLQSQKIDSATAQPTEIVENLSEIPRAIQSINET